MTYKRDLSQLKSREVLEKCKLAYSILSNESSEEKRELCWIVVISLLRSVGYVLKNSDEIRFNAIKELYSYEEWQIDKHFSFLENERNLILKEWKGTANYKNDLLKKEGGGYLLTESGNRIIIGNSDQLYKNDHSNEFESKKPNEVLEEIINWFESKISYIEAHIAHS